MPRRPALTYAQAAAAAQALGLRTHREYRARHHEVPGLPPVPEQAYAAEWVGWSVFLATVATRRRTAARRALLPLNDAAAAVHAAGIRTPAEYTRRYREVPGLPSNPDQHYPDWPGWPAFLGRTPRTGPLLSLPEWIETVRALGITTSTEYARRYQERPDLPSNPYRAYPDFPGWRAALEKWAQPSRQRRGEMLPYGEARRVARDAGWRTMREYVAGRRDHPGLPVRPSAVYPEWPGWPAFLGRSEEQMERRAGRPRATIHP